MGDDVESVDSDFDENNFQSSLYDIMNIFGTSRNVQVKVGLNRQQMIDLNEIFKESYSHGDKIEAARKYLVDNDNNVEFGFQTLLSVQDIYSSNNSQLYSIDYTLKHLFFNICDSFRDFSDNTRLEFHECVRILNDKFKESKNEIPVDRIGRAEQLIKIINDFNNGNEDNMFGKDEITILLEIGRVVNIPSLIFKYNNKNKDIKYCTEMYELIKTTNNKSANTRFFKFEELKQILMTTNVYPLLYENKFKLYNFELLVENFNSALLNWLVSGNFIFLYL
jgi:hypothetical protein